MNKLFESIKVPFFTVLFIFIFLYAFSALFGPIPLGINSTSSADLFTVEGEGEALATPDQASFTVGVTQNGASADVAKNAVTESTNKIIAALTQLGVKEADIKTQNYSVFPNQDFQPGGRGNITNYTANQELNVKVESVELANQALDVATAQGANNISGVQFTLDDQDTKKLEMEARKKAIADAKTKAKDIADAAGVRLGRIVSVREGSGMQPPIAFDRMELATKNEVGSAPTDLQPGENTVKITVSLSYETL